MEYMEMEHTQQFNVLKEMQDDGTLRDMVEKYGLDAEKALGVTNAE